MHRRVHKARKNGEDRAMHPGNDRQLLSETSMTEAMSKIKAQGEAR